MLDLWRRDDGRSGGDRPAARRELIETTGRVVGWYDDVAARMVWTGDYTDAVRRLQDTLVRSGQAVAR